MKEDILWALRMGRISRGNRCIPLNLQGLGPINDDILDLLPWYCDTDKLKFEVDTVKRSFGDRFELKRTRFGELYWEGFIHTPTRSSLVRAYYPQGRPGIDFYPLSPPRAYPIPLIFDSPHTFKDFSMCLFDPKDPTSLAWNPFTDTAAEIIKWADFWLFKQGYWEESGHWPGPEAKHGGSVIPTYLHPLFESMEKRRKR